MCTCGAIHCTCTQVKSNMITLKEKYRHNQSRLSTGHGIGVLVLLAHLCSSNGNMTLSWRELFSVTEFHLKQAL